MGRPVRDIYSSVGNKANLLLASGSLALGPWDWGFSTEVDVLHDPAASCSKGH